MAHEFTDLKGFLFLVLITIPQTLSTNIDCGGKPFHCLNTTHFMICVDLGGGVSSTIDDFIIPCPPTTVCERNNRFECEFPKIEAFTTDLNVIGVSNEYDKSAHDKTIPPDKWTTVLSLPEKTTVTELPTKEKSMNSLNIEVLENLKDEFTGGNEKFLDEDIVPVSSVVNLKNNIDETSFVPINSEKFITTTDKYPHTKTNANTSAIGVVSVSRTDIPTLKDNITFTEESKTINNNPGNKFNTTKKLDQLYVNELNQTINKFIGVGELTTPLPNSSVSIRRIYNLDLDPDNSSSIHQSLNFDLQKKIFKTVPISRNVSHITADTLSTSEKVVASTSKYNDTEMVDNRTATKSNSLTLKLNTTATNYSVEPTTEKLRQDDEYSHTLQSATVNPIEINTKNLYSNPSGKDLLKLNETDISTEGFLILNELDTSNKYNTTNKIDQNNINELNRTSDKFIEKLDSTTSQDIVDLVNVSNKSELHQKVQNPDLVLVTVSEMTINTLNTTESGLVISEYNGHDNVIASEAMVKNSLLVNANSTDSNYVVKSVTEVLKKDDEYKNVSKSVTAIPAEKSMTTRVLSYDLGTTNTNIIFAEVPLVTNVNHTSNSSDKHETLQKIVTTNLSIKPVKQTVLESLSTSDSNNTMQDSNGFTFKMTTPPTLVNDENKIGFKGDSEIKSKENASIFNDSKIKVGINKTKEDYFPTKTGNIDLMINFNMKPTTNLIHSYISKIAAASQTTLMNNNQTSATESPITSADRQSVSTGDNTTFNLNSFVVNKVQSVPVQASLSYYTPTIEKPKTTNQKQKPLLNNLTTFDEISLGIEPSTTVDFIQQQSNHMDRKYNISTDLEVESSSLLPTITLININETNKVTQNTTPVPPSEAVTYSGDNSNNQDTIIRKRIDFVSDTAKINETLKTLEINDISFKTSEIGANSTVDSDLFQLPTSGNLTLLIGQNDDITLEPPESVLKFLNELDTSNKYNTTNKIDQNNINELNRTSDKFIETLDSTTSQDIVDLVNVSDKSELQQKVQNPDLILVTVSEMTIDTLSTTEPGLVISEYNGHDNVIASEAMEKNSLPVNANSTDSNYVVKSVTEVLKKDDEYKNLSKSVIAIPAAKSLTTTVLSHDLGTTNTNIILVNDISFKTSGIGANSTVDSDSYQLPTPGNLTLLIGQNDDITLEPPESVTANIEEHKQNITNIMETTTELDGTTRYPLITKSVTESIFSKNMSAETPSSNDIVVSTQTVMEYTKNESTLNDKEGNAITSKSDIYTGLLDNTAKSLFHPLKKSNESNRASTVLVTDVSQDTHLSPNDESKTRNNITKASAIDTTELETGFDRNKLLTSNATTKKPPIIVVNRILPSMTAGVIQHNTNVFDNAGKQSESSNATQSTHEAIARKLDSISTFPTPVAVTAQKQPNIVVNRIVPSTMASISQYTKDELIKVEKQIVNSNIESSTEQIVISDLDSISTVPALNETTVEKKPNILVTRILASTMTSVSQVNIDELANVETPIKRFNILNSKSTLPTTKVSTATEEPNITVNRILFSTTASISQPSTDDLGKVQTRSWSLNITQSTSQKIASDLDNISMLSTTNENIAKNGSNTTGNGILPSTVASISQPDSDESGKDKTRMESSDVTQSTRKVFVNLSDSTAALPHELTAMKEPNITVKQILLSNMAAITQSNIDELGIAIETPIGNLNISDSTRQTVANNFNSTSVLWTPNKSTAQKESNITVNRLLPSTMTSFSLLNTDELDKVQIQVESSNVTQTTLQIVDSNLHNASKLPTLKKSIAEKEHNITVNLLALNTLAPISQNITDDAVKLGTPFVSSKVTRSSQQIIGNDFDKTSFNIVTEPAAIVESINDTHNIVGRPILSDLILSNVIFMNETTNLKSINKLNNEISKKITEKATLYDELQKTTLLRNTSTDLNKREDLIFDVENGTFVDRQINIELSGSTHDNETSEENYESSTAYNTVATLVDVTSPSTPVNKSVSNVGYKSPRSAVDIARPGYMSKNFSDLTNITLLNKMKYIYNSTNNMEAKEKNLTRYNIFSKQQIKQLNGSAVSQISNININNTSNYQMSNKSNLITVIHLLASANAKNPPITVNANKEKNTTFTVDCVKLSRGKYADSKDCRKFYICVGKLQPIVGTCPNNTVFSEINKQCTRNLSHCVRNNQFHCLCEGRFRDLLRDNIYYICVKNNLNGFLRYKLQCQNGYHLNKATVKCEKNEIWNQSDTSLSNSSNVSNDRNISVSNSDASESSGDGEFDCKKEGKFPYPNNCRKYYVCTKNSKDEFRRKIKSCSSEEIYDRKKKKCVSSDSEES